MKSFLLRCSSVFLCLVIFGCHGNSNPTFSPGERAPDISFTTLSGEPKHLSDYAGKTVLLTFWASWCPECRQEIPSLISLYEKLGKKGLVILAVGVGDKLDSVKSASVEAKMPYDVMFDETNGAADTYRTSGIPEAFIINKDGTFALIQDPASNDAAVRIVGPRGWNDPSLSDQLEKLL